MSTQQHRTDRLQTVTPKPRRRPIWLPAVAMAGLLVAGVVGWGVLQDLRSGPDHPVPAHASADGTGLVDGDGQVHVEIWLDLHCPACREFAREMAPELDRLVADGVITRTYRPVVEGRTAGASFATRASASTACAADLHSHPAYLRHLLTTSLDPDGAGLSDDDLIRVGGEVGMIDPTFARCVRDQQYQDWTARVTGQAARDGVTGTPAVRVDGAMVAPVAAEVTSVIRAAAEGS